MEDVATPTAANKVEARRTMQNPSPTATTYLMPRSAAMVRSFLPRRIVWVPTAWAAYFLNADDPCKTFNIMEGLMIANLETVLQQARCCWCCSITCIHRGGEIIQQQRTKQEQCVAIGLVHTECSQPKAAGMEQELDRTIPNRASDHGGASSSHVPGVGGYYPPYLGVRTGHL
jgi:hypothetical protein